VTAAEQLATSIHPETIAMQEDRAARIEMSLHAATALRSTETMTEDRSQSHRIVVPLEEV
jgi:hypothetical protein